MDILVIVDMQNDFITGSLHNDEAKKIIPYIINPTPLGVGLET